MGNSSSRTTSEMGISAKVTQSNSVSQDMDCSALNINSVSQNVANSNCIDGIHLEMSNIDMQNEGECRIEGNMISLNNQEASQDLQQTLTQASEAVTKGFNLGNSSQAIAESNSNISAEVNQNNTVSQKCFSSTLNVNRLQQNIYNDNTEGSCNELIEDISLSNKAKAIGQCGLQSSNVQKSDQAVKQTVEQTASATTEGIDFMALGFLVLCIAVLVFVVFSSVGAGAVGTVVSGVKGFLSIVYQIFGYVIGPLFIIYSIYTIITIYSQYNDLTTKHPWEIEDIDIPTAIRIMLIIKDLEFSVTNKYIEKVKTKVIKPGGAPPEQHNDGVYFINYSSVHYIDKTLTDQDSIRETLKSKGLQNPKLYRFSVNNKGIEDDKYNESDNPTPETAKTHMINNNYYAFEIIYYGVYSDGTTVKLDRPITLFYTNLDENLWNYDLIGKSECEENSSDENKITSCGIETSINSKQCNGDNSSCELDEFCGLGNTGCVNCKYCKYRTDGYGITKDTKPEDVNADDTCLKKCEDYTEGRESLEAKINDCKICKGRVLQQSELFSDDNIIIGNNPWNKVNYSPELLNSEIYNNSEYQGNVRYENGKFQAYTDTGWNNIDLNQIGFNNYPTESQMSSINLDISNDDKNYIKFSGLPPSLSNSKCLMQTITYNDDIPNIGRNYIKLSPSPGGGYENVDNVTGICYDANDHKCVDKYSTMCVNFQNKKNSIHECDPGSYMNLYKTLLHDNATEQEKTCADISLQSSISDDEWKTCKNFCCVSNPPSTRSSPDYLDQVMCTHIPERSIKITPRYIPFRSNIVGIRMYRDFSDMNQKVSPMNLVKDTAMIILVVFAVILLICGFLCYKIISSFRNKNNSSDVDNG